jgi:hypothetical protein
LRFVLSNCIKVLASSKAEVSYVFHRNDVDTLQTITVDIKRIHSVDIGTIRGRLKTKVTCWCQVHRENAAPDTSPVKHWRINLFFPRYPVIVDVTRVLGLGKAENERLQHIDVTGRTINNLKIV